MQRDDFLELQPAVLVPVKCIENVAVHGHIAVAVVEEVEELINADFVILIRIH